MQGKNLSYAPYWQLSDQSQQSLAMTEQAENSTWEGPGHGSVVQVEWGTPAPGHGRDHSFTLSLRHKYQIMVFSQ